MMSKKCYLTLAKIRYLKLVTFQNTTKRDENRITKHLSFGNFHKCYIKFNVYTNINDDLCVFLRVIVLFIFLIEYQVLYDNIYYTGKRLIE